MNGRKGSIMDAEKAKATLDSFRASMKPKGGTWEEPDPGKILTACKRTDGSELRISLKEYQGRPWVDARIWQTEGERMIPTKKGVGFKTRELPEVVEALMAAMEAIQATKAKGEE